MSYRLKAVFYPAEEPDSAYLGNASLTVADAVLIQGIAVLRQGKSDSPISLAFPTFGSPRRSYIQPWNNTAYDRIYAVISDAVKDIRFSRAELPGNAQILLSAAGQLSENSNPDGLYSLQIDGFCTLHGIITTQSSWPLPDGSKIAVHMPMLESLQTPGQRLTVFEGLITAREQPDGSMEYKDYQQIIQTLVREARQNLIMNRSHAAFAPDEQPVVQPSGTQDRQPEQTPLPSEIVR